MVTLAWGARVPEWFRQRVIRIGQERVIDPSHLMACMKFESNFDPTARNPGSTASGLIQFMKGTAEELDTTIEAIREMSAMEQLEMVDAYFKLRIQQFGRIRSLSDCYMAILSPASVGKSEDAVIFPAGSKAYLANFGLDLDHDNEITKAEAAQFVTRALAEGMKPGNVFTAADTQPPAPIEDHSTTLPPVTPQEKPMGGLLGSLLMSVIGGFAKSQQVTSVVDKAGPLSPVVTALLNTVLSQVATQAGTTPAAMQADDKAAIAAVSVVQADTAKMAAVEDAALTHLNAVGPLIDKMAQMDKDLWAAQNAGKQTSSSIAIEEHKAGIWDMTRTVVMFAAGVLTVLVVALLGAVVYQSVTGDRSIDPGLLGLSGPIFMAAVTAWAAVIAYRMDGTKESHASAETMRAMASYREEVGR